MFDMGALVHPQKPDVVFLTHTHNDHITFMGQILNDQYRRTDVYLPSKALPLVQEFLASHQRMIECEEESSDNPAKHYTLHPLDFGDVVDITHRGTKYTVRALECHHRIDCLGFSIFRTVRKLKPEYQKMEGREIGRLRKEGVDIHDTSNEPFLCHLGDTTHRVFERHPEILQQHKYIVVECSFFCEKTRGNADKTMHMHWDDLKPFVESHPNVLFILIHFSLRYSALDIRHFFLNATSTKNVHPMLVESELHQQGNRNRYRAPRCNCFECEEFYQKQESKRQWDNQSKQSSSSHRPQNHSPRKKRSGNRSENRSNKHSDIVGRGEEDCVL